MPKTTEIKKGEVLSLKGQLFKVKQIEIQNPSARGAATLYKMRFANVKTGAKHEEHFKGDEVLERVDLLKRAVSYSYDEGDAVVFMDNQDFTQFSINKSDIEDELLFITESIKGVFVLILDEAVIGIELPQSVELEIIETPPAIKGASADTLYKSAELSTGLSVQVPEYLAPGERIKVHTTDKKFMGRVD